MQKNFDQWNGQKKRLDEKRASFFYKQGEVWWCAVGINIAEESCGKGSLSSRPVLVLKKLSQNNFIGIPLSTKKKVGTWFVDIQVQEQPVSALLYQVRMFSVKRFQRRLTTLDQKDFKQVKEKLEALLELSGNYHPDTVSGIGGLPQK